MFGIAQRSNGAGSLALFCNGVEQYSGEVFRSGKVSYDASSNGVARIGIDLCSKGPARWRGVPFCSGVALRSCDSRR